MKIRNGFVSNSSSSSFIIGYASIKDENNFQKYIKENNIEFYDNKFSDKPIRFKEEIRKFLTDERGEIELVGGNDTSIIIPNEIINEDLIFVEITNNEGDGCFYGESDFSNYEKAEREEFYSENQQKIIKLFKQDFLEYRKLIIGAERNG